jgi:hypothetical protein
VFFLLKFYCELLTITRIVTNAIHLPTYFTHFSLYAIGIDIYYLNRISQLAVVVLDSADKVEPFLGEHCLEAETGRGQFEIAGSPF